MSVHEALVTYALVGLPVGLLTGLGLGLVARFQDGWGGYGSFRRRAARLGHVSLVMLPLIAGFYALLLDGRPFEPALARWGAWLWISGGIALASALFLAAWRPSLRAVMALPAVALFAGGVAFALSHLLVSVGGGQ